MESAIAKYISNKFDNYYDRIASTSLTIKPHAAAIQEFVDYICRVEPTLTIQPGVSGDTSVCVDLYPSQYQVSIAIPVNEVGNEEGPNIWETLLRFNDCNELDYYHSYQNSFNRTNYMTKDALYKALVLEIRHLQEKINTQTFSSPPGN